MIEWAERVKDVLPQECLWVELTTIDDQSRRIKIEARGERYRQLLESIVIRES